MNTYQSNELSMLDGDDGSIFVQLDYFNCAHLENAQLATRLKSTESLTIFMSFIYKLNTTLSHSLGYINYSKQMLHKFLSRSHGQLMCMRVLDKACQC